MGYGRFGRFAALAFLVAAGAACRSAPIDLVNDCCPPTEVRVAGTPLGACHVRLRQDQRPIDEHGEETVQGESLLADQRLRAPIAEAILGVIARDSRLAGLFTKTSLYAAAQPFHIDVTILHARAGHTSGLQTVVPVLPFSAIDAWVALRIAFADNDGRVFVEREFERRLNRAAAPLEGLEGTSADLLGTALRQLVDELLPEIKTSYDAYWQRFGVTDSRPAA